MPVVVSAVPAADSASLLPGLGILAGPLRGGALVQDYLAGAPPLSRFYAGHPADPEAYRRKAAEVSARLGAAARARVAPAIEPLGDAADRLRRITAGDGFFVTTGQQPALFGGPLYTLYKTLAAIRLAESLEGLLGRPVLALFWIGADDHDWDEASGAALLDGRGYARALRVQAPTDVPPLPLSERPWGSGIESAVAEFAALLPDGPLTADVAQHVRDAYTPGDTVAASFTATFRFLLRDQRIALVNSAHPALRQAAAPVLRADAARWHEHGQGIERQSARLAAAGYDVQVAVTDGAANIMLLDELGRDRLVRGSGGWVTRRERRPIADGELLRRIEQEPERFSPNVLLRPVVESALFPTLAYVAGPGELKYFAQIGCLFRAHGMLPPVVVPRPSVRLVEPAIARTLDRLGLQPDDVAQPYDHVAARVTRSGLPAAVPAALERLRSMLRDGYADLAAAATPIDPSLVGPLASARNASLVQLAEAERRIERRFRRRNDVLMEQVRRATASLQPDGAPQERVLSPLPFFARYGRPLIAAIRDALDLEPRGSVDWDGPGCEG
jgi:bacillithiol synthase